MAFYFTSLSFFDKFIIKKLSDFFFWTAYIVVEPEASPKSGHTLDCWLYFYYTAEQTWTKGHVLLVIHALPVNERVPFPNCYLLENCTP